ncbi:MAG: PQQ-dependent dehydrogenase, methanol/ethanol family [Bryobacterales bacterium]|nr:PQQ-dependent dehydrogenase, methanol/ethanol family [Bryobacterales bacterium]
MRICWFLLAALPALAQNAGQVAYSENCAICHGAAGEGGSGPDLTSAAWQASMTDADLEAVIERGRPGTAMPGFAGRVNPKELISHLRALGRTAIRPTTDLQTPPISVSNEQLLRAGGERSQWLHYGRDYTNQRFSPLNQVHRGNVTRLAPLWSFQTGTPDGLQASPLVVNGVIYMTASWNYVFAIDARTGAELWRYRKRLPEKLKYCCGPVNRGVAIHGGTLYMATLDARLVALDARTGRVKWDVEVGRVEENHSCTGPPLVVGDRVIVGMAGGDYATRGFIDAYDAGSGKRLWRFWTIPGPGEKGNDTWSGDSWKTGGGATWMNGSYDPEFNLIYWGIGNPYPDYDGDVRTGDNLYTNCVVALDPETGALRWHYQFTPWDVWDYDGVNEMVLVDLKIGGRERKALVHADRNGHFFAVDRGTGEFLYAKPFVRVNWAKGFDAKGRPIVNPDALTNYEGVEVCPGAAGGKEWNAMAYSPLTRLVYVPVIENCAIFSNYGAEAKKKGLPPGPSGFRYLPNQAYGKVTAVHADTGEIAWEVRTRTPMGSGMLATGGGLVFTGDAEGNFTAFDDRNGKLLWSYQTGSGIRAAPITFELDGRQYVAIASGMAGAIRGYTGPGAPWMQNYRSGGTLYVFALFEPGASTRFHGGAKR